MIMMMTFGWLGLVFVALILRVILDIAGSLFRLAFFAAPVYILYRLFHRNRYYC